MALNDPLPALAPRQAEVADLVADGLTDYQIAVQLGVSESTVKTQLQSIKRHWGSANRATIAAQVAYRRGFRDGFEARKVLATVQGQLAALKLEG